MIFQAPPPTAAAAASSAPSSASPAPMPQAHVKIGCTVTVEGKLTDCQVIEENPPGHGFGADVLKMASKFRMKPPLRNGQPVEGKVTIPVTLKLAP